MAEKKQELTINEAFALVKLLLEADTWNFSVSPNDNDSHEDREKEWEDDKEGINELCYAPMPIPQQML
uniref:Uncharacterized protein n=1 Tax=Ditylenchus dipsaci TaxID=166011 RepID=A0A915CSH9_9BILA